jgi:diaminopimelate epimerase
MNYYNADGTLAEMCGNGVRCTAKFLIELTKSEKDKTKKLLIDTRSGTREVVCNSDGSFSVNMGVPIFSHSGLLDFPKNPLTLENISLNFVSMGNPHAVGIVQDLSSIDISQIGPKIENDSHFPNKINLELVEKVADDYFKVKVWERGSGATLACGSGACAVYAVIKSQYPIGKTYGVKEVTLKFPGGNLYLSENKKGEIILRGEAVCVFRGRSETKGLISN